MPGRIYKRDCNSCGKYYEGRGAKYCSHKCSVSKSVEQRVWEKVRIRDLFECWEWIGYHNGDGYGEFDWRFEKVAHRAVWRLIHGEIPKGKFLCHTCDNPGCCNPAHLFVGSAADNSADMVEKGRQARGEKNCKAKLTEVNVRKIRQMLIQGKRKCDIARLFEVSKSTIGDISFGRSWQYLKE